MVARPERSEIMDGESIHAHVAKLTSAETFPLWKFQIEILLQSKGLLSHLTGLTTRRELATTSKPEDFKEVSDWEVKDAKV